MESREIVQKPWGYEYIAFQNNHVAVKVLHIDCGERTSLHCHPNKSTGLVLIGGKAIINFIADQSLLVAPAKKMIRRGLFHQTHAVSDEGVVMLEVETPVDQDDLVRMKDNYGRKNQGYERHRDTNKESCVFFEVPNSGTNSYSLGTSKLEIGYVSNFDHYNDDDIVMFLQGGIVKTVNDRQHMVTQPGDVGTIKVVKQVFEEMDGLASDTIILTIK